MSSITTERLDEMLAELDGAWWTDQAWDGPIDPDTMRSVLTELRAFRTQTAGTEAIEIADALDEFADIDANEGGNPHVIETERRAAKMLRVLSTLTAAKGVEVTEVMKEVVLLSIIAHMRGGQADVSDYDWHWIGWFCGDETGGGDDTFNRCIDKGWLRSTHDSDTDSSTAYITPAGRAALTASLSKVG